MGDYYPFGLAMSDRSYKVDSYRYGFNGKENDSDFGNKQVIQDYGFRLYNPSLGKFLSEDPLSPKYPWYTPYQFAGNKPIEFIDLDGLEEAKPDNNSGVSDGNRSLSNLNYIEIAYILFNADNALILNKSDGALAISADLTGALNKHFAESVVKANNKKRLTSFGISQSKALRHTMGSAMAVQDVGLKESKKAADVHERREFGLMAYLGITKDYIQAVDNGEMHIVGALSSTIFYPENSTKEKKEEALEKAWSLQDLLNNEIGRQLALDNPNASAFELAKKALTIYHDNGLYTAYEIKDEKNNVKGYGVKLTKLSDQQFQNSIKEFDGQIRITLPQLDINFADKRKSRIERRLKNAIEKTQNINSHYRW